MEIYFILCIALFGRPPLLLKPLAPSLLLAPLPLLALQTADEPAALVLYPSSSASSFVFTFASRGPRPVRASARWAASRSRAEILSLSLFLSLAHHPILWLSLSVWLVGRRWRPRRRRRRVVPFSFASETRRVLIERASERTFWFLIPSSAATAAVASPLRPQPPPSVRVCVCARARANSPVCAFARLFARVLLAIAAATAAGPRPIGFAIWHTHTLTQNGSTKTRTTKLAQPKPAKSLR